MEQQQLKSVRVIHGTRLFSEDYLVIGICNKVTLKPSSPIIQLNNSMTDFGRKLVWVTNNYVEIYI